MAISRRIALKVIAALLAATAALAPLGSARAAPGCSLDDLGNALESMAGSIPSCAAACVDGAGCLAAAAATAVLGAVSADGAVGDVDQFCSELQNVSGGDVLGLLNQIPIPGLSTVLSDLASPLAVASCACSLEQGAGQFFSDLGDCFQDAACAVLGWDCPCTPPPPVALNCPQSNSQCGTYDLNNTLPADVVAACEGQGTLVVAGSNYCQQGAANCVTNSSGTLVTVPNNIENEQGQCAPETYCFCPAPMVPTWTPDSLADLSSSTSGLYIFSCNCPAGQHPQGTLGGISVCACDGTNAAPLPPGTITLLSGGGATTSACPPPGCTAGQISLGGKCVTPCSNPSEGMTMDGSCCNPSLMTSCGICCKAGTTPNPANGSCESFPAPK